MAPAGNHAFEALRAVLCRKLAAKDKGWPQANADQTLAEGLLQATMCLRPWTLCTTNWLSWTRAWSRVNAYVIVVIRTPAGNHVFETLDAVYHKLAAKDKGVAQVLRLQWEGSRLSYAHERGKEVGCWDEVMLCLLHVSRQKSCIGNVSGEAIIVLCLWAIMQQCTFPGLWPTRVVTGQ